MTLRAGAAGTRIAAWLAVMLSLVMSVVANAASRDDYARQWPLTLGQEESGAYRVLLDEAVSHLDGQRREALFGEILALGLQAWLTGTDRDLFRPLAGQAQFFAVEDGRVHSL